MRSCQNSVLPEPQTYVLCVFFCVLGYDFTYFWSSGVNYFKPQTYSPESLYLGRIKGVLTTKRGTSPNTTFRALSEVYPKIPMLGRKPRQMIIPNSQKQDQKAPILQTIGAQVETPKGPGGQKVHTWALNPKP